MNKSKLDFIQKVRDFLEDPHIKKMYVGFNDFPAGSCADASELLGYLMKMQGFGEYLMVYGENSEGVTHAWLESESELIDITSDQFASSNGEIIVKAKEGKNRIHLGFTVKRSSIIEAKYIFINYFNVLREIEARIRDISS